MPSHHRSLDVSLILDHIQCIDEGDGPGLAEPYLWTLFFKIDGTTVQLVKLPNPPLTITLQGMVTVNRRNGSHRNLRDTDEDPVDEGEDVAIPAQLGRWDTTLVPIPISDDALVTVKNQLADLPGTIGVICILMEEDNLPDSAANAGYNAFCSTFESKMNERINSRTLGALQADDNQQFQDDLTDAIRDAVINAIKDDINILQAAWNFIAGTDQMLGSGAFTFDHDDLDHRSQIFFDARWKTGINVDPSNFFSSGSGNIIESGGDWKIYGRISSDPSPVYTGSFGPVIAPDPSEMAMRDFTRSAELATREGFVGGFPNFLTAIYGRNNVAGTIFLKQGCSVWRDVPIEELGNPALADFAGRFRGTNLYARDKAFVGGFPNFFHAESLVLVAQQTAGHGSGLKRGIVCGTVLIKPGCGEYREISLRELGNPNLSDIGARFRATADYAAKHGFVGGFPDFFHRSDGVGIVCGAVLLTPGAAEWRDVLVSIGPA